MAKLSSYYTLCPLIDQQNLLGVEEDSSSGCAVVTLGRNIVIRYKLQDLKQLGSWSTKERLTTQVIYDKSSGKYAAIFNERHARVWSEDQTDLDKVKRYKFDFQFHTILMHHGLPPILVRQNGSTASLSWALANRKTWKSEGFLRPDEKIVECHLAYVNEKTYFCALVQIGNRHNYIVAPLHPETFLEDNRQIVRIELTRPSEVLVGQVLMQDKRNAYLLTLWSHGRLYSYCLTAPSPSATEETPGTLITLITGINTKYPVAMTPLNENTVAMYGADAKEEGAILMIYNVRFKLAQAVQKLKLYTRDAKLWRVEDKLLLAANRHLAIAPFRLAPERIEAMLGSSLRFKSKTYKKEDEEDDEEEEEEVVVIQECTTAKWLDDLPIASPSSQRKNVPSKIAKEITSYGNEGWSDAAIQQALIPRLIQSKDITAIVWCIETLKDLPEKLLTDLLAFALRTPEETFVPIQNGQAEDGERTNNRAAFLDKLLALPYFDIALLSNLKSKLNFQEILQLLDYLIKKLNSTEKDDSDDSTTLTEKKLYEWATLLLDSHYQQYIMSQDTQVINVLDGLMGVLDDHLQLIKDVEGLRPQIARIIKGKTLKPIPKNGNKFYSIEEIKLY